MNRRTRQSDIEIRDAEIERLRSENEQLREVARMEREALIGASKEVERILRGRIAELEAAQRPVAFSERKPEDGQRVLAYNWEYRGYWEMYDYHDDNYGVPNCLTHWLPMPPVWKASA